MFYEMKMDIVFSILIFSVVFIANIFILRKIVRAGNQPKNSKTSFRENVIRGLIVSVIIILITESAKYIGNKWSAIVSSFPSTLYPVIIILHYEEKNILYPLVIKGFSLGVSTLVVFYLCCKFLIPVFGLNIGFLYIYFISVVYLYILHKSRKVMDRLFGSG
jgi:hypothetical protein